MKERYRIVELANPGRHVLLQGHQVWFADKPRDQGSCRGITADEHARIIAREPNAERRDF